MACSESCTPPDPYKCYSQASSICGHLICQHLPHQLVLCTYYGQFPPLRFWFRQFVSFRYSHLHGSGAGSRVIQQVPILRLPIRLRVATRVKRRSFAGCDDSRFPLQAPRPSRRVLHEVEDLVRQQRYESDGVVNPMIKGVQDTINAACRRSSQVWRPLTPR